jgi:hypothetical protein
MDTYQLPQPAECVDFQNETMFINEGPLDIVIDFVGRIFKGSNSTSLAQQLFDELVIIQDRKLLIDSLIISNAHGVRLVENKEGGFYIVDEKDRILKGSDDIQEAQHEFDSISSGIKTTKKENLCRRELLADEYGICLNKGKDKIIEYWLTNSLGQNSSKNVSFEKAFSVFYTESQRIESGHINGGEIIYQMGGFKLLETQDPNKAFYILDSQDKIYKKHKSRDMAAESLENIYREKAMYHSVEIGF